MTHLHQLLTYIFVLTSVVTLHEMGHYLACKFQGIDVDTFSVGFGPILASTTLWGTLFTLRAIPLGGFIIPSGITKRPETSEGNEYFSKAWYRRLVVVYAGPAMNFLLAFTIFVGLLMFRGMPTYSTAPIIGEVQKGSVAEELGLLSGDRVTAINGVGIYTWKDVQSAISLAAHSQLDINFHRKGVEGTISIAASSYFTPPLGISPEVVVVPQSLWMASKESVRICTFQVTETTKLLAAKFAHKDKSELMGPIGIYQAVAQASSDWVEVFSLMAIISLSLGIFNLLPIPLLDGGSAMLFWWEGLIGKYPSTLVINIFQLIGLAIIGFILLFATVGDITRLLHS